MKKKGLILSLVATMLMVLTSSCSKDFVAPTMITHYYEVNKYMWTDDDSGSFLIAGFEDADITANAIDNGVIMVYYLNGDYDQPLPYIQYLEATDDNGDPVLYQEKIDYDLCEGKIFFKIAPNDFDLAATQADLPSKMEFKVTVIQNAYYRI